MWSLRVVSSLVWWEEGGVFYPLIIRNIAAISHCHSGGNLLSSLSVFQLNIMVGRWTLFLSGNFYFVNKILQNRDWGWDWRDLTQCVIVRPLPTVWSPGIIPLSSSSSSSSYHYSDIQGRTNEIIADSTRIILVTYKCIDHLEIHKYLHYILRYLDWDILCLSKIETKEGEDVS